MPNDTTFSQLSIPPNIYFVSSTIIVTLSPVAVLGNILILDATWKKTFQRTPFHVPLSGLAITDLCTGFIAWPLLAGNTLLRFNYYKNFLNRSDPWAKSEDRIVIYFIFLTLFIMTVMSTERWLYVSRSTNLTNTASSMFDRDRFSASPNSIGCFSLSTKNVWTTRVHLICGGNAVLFCNHDPCLF